MPADIEDTDQLREALPADNRDINVLVQLSARIVRCDTGQGVRNRSDLGQTQWQGTARGQEADMDGVFAS